MLHEITVAVCCYNSAKYIEDTLEGIFRQTCQDFDLLIIDDCSTDNTMQVVRTFFEKNPRAYRLIDLEVNGGIAHARQLALEQSRGKYLLFVDSDDLPCKTLVEREYALISSDPDRMAVSCWSAYMDQAGKKLRGGLFMGAKTKEEFFSLASRNKLIFFPVQTMFDREAALRAGGYRLDGFPEEKPRYRDFCEDLDLWTRMSDLFVEGRYMISIPEVLYSYRKSDTGLSSNIVGMSLKIKYVKVNLLLRRAGKAERTFVDFLADIPEKEMKKIKREARGTDCLRSSVFLLLKWRIFTAAYYFARAVSLNPKYVVQKLKTNSGLFK